ncbi:serine/threonine-protein kinase [Aquimonas voraii]|uniref:Serine/threonine protein kinase n=1 Tax=Aquimonas voraii TaxID=265719 RepID=A0A1G6S6G6_9GAMM|nr:serine/threonine-protein kinase [Aquimonas voraii]SDD12284.1 serine/threonine protein kinase [Aquimonas voraii]
MTAGPEDPTTRALDSEPGVEAAHGLPERIGPFRILGLLGEGGMGRVYRALEHAPLREVALKVAGLPTRAALERFAREIELLAQLEHPGIARLYATGVDVHSGLPWLSMELVPGEDLARWVARAQPDRETLLRVLLSICAAVQYAHGRGVLHRDLKPSNVFVAPDGSTRVLDFGIARLLQTGESRDPTLTVAGQILGTLPYMAPEQLAGEPVDVRGDVYALGVIAYELLGGQLPYPRLRTASAFEALDIVRAGDPPPLASLSRHAQGDLGEVVMKAIAPERGRRYASVDALAADLHAVLESRPVSARAPTPAYLIGRFTRRHRALSIAVAGIACVLVAATAVSLRFAWSENKARAEAEARATEAQAIGDFLTSMLQSADPERSLGRELRVNELLFGAGEALQADASMPVVTRARLLGALADAHLGLSDGQRAAELLEAALALPEGETMADLRLRLAIQRLNADLVSGQFDAIDPRAEALLKQFDDAIPAEQQLDIEQIRLRARIEKGERESALADLQTALQRADTSLGASHRITLALRHDLASVLQLLGRFAEAAEVNAASVSAYLLRYGADHPQTLYARNLAATLKFRLGDETGALADLEDVYTARRRMLGETHPSTLSSGLNLATALVNQGEAKRSEDLARSALEGLSDRFGPDHRLALNARDTLALALEKQGRIDEAADLHAATLELYRSLGRLEAPEALGVLNNLAMLRMDARQLDQALRHFDTLVERARQSLGAEHVYTGMFMGNRAQCMAELGRFIEAREGFETSLAVLRATLGEDHPRTQRVLNQYEAILGER